MEIDESVGDEAVETCYSKSFVCEVTLVIVSCDSVIEEESLQVVRADRAYNNGEENGRGVGLYSPSEYRLKTRVSSSRTDRVDQYWEPSLA